MKTWKNTFQGEFLALNVTSKSKIRESCCGLEFHYDAKCKLRVWDQSVAWMAFESARRNYLISCSSSSLWRLIGNSSSSCWRAKSFQQSVTETVSKRSSQKQLAWNWHQILQVLLCSFNISYWEYFQKLGKVAELGSLLKLERPFFEKAIFPPQTKMLHLP